MWKAYRNTAVLQQAPKVVCQQKTINVSIRNNPMMLKNSLMIIECSLAEPQPVTMTLYSMAGVKIRTWASSERASHYSQVVWEGKDSHGDAVHAGIYYLDVRTTNDHIVKTIMVCM
jgi:flagellar hook assembly protein FlgD